MATNRDYRPRLSIEITPHQAKALQDLIPWGLKNQLFSIIIDDVIGLASQHGGKFLAAILSRSINLSDYSVGKDL